MKCPNCGSECCISAYNEYKCQACGVTFAVNQNFSAAANADETDKTIPPRREHEFNAADDVTMPGRRDRKKDGAFEAGDLVINRYRVISKLGQGGMGAVYKCLDETAGIEIALKALPPELSNNTLEMEDIKDNFQLVSKLVHQNIANLRQLEKDNSNGNYYLIMECCEGEDLRRWIKRRRQSGKISAADILPIISQIADALDYAHDQKIIHRDIKPGNIMIAADGTIKVLDFGLAAQIHTSMTRVSMAHYGTSGTGPYMAPEQWRGRAQGATADQYALAVMSYEMLAGHVPFESSDAAVLKQAVLDETPEKIADIPESAWNAIIRAMSKDPAERFESCSDFAAALGSKKIKSSCSAKTAPALKWGIIAGFVLVLVGIVCFFLFKPTPEQIYNKARQYYVVKDYEKALPLLRKAADAGNADAQYNLGVCYANGFGVTKDYYQAVYWYKKAAEQGYAAAQCNLGFCYYHGNGVTQDYNQAVYWYRRAAEQGNMYAQNNFGFCYEKGHGVAQDWNQAVYWYRRAAEQGHAIAQCNLGVCYYYGNGVTKNYNQAVYWYKKAAEQGQVNAQCNLGICYENGYGVTRDIEQAVYWYRKAADQGFADAQKALQRLGR